MNKLLKESLLVTLFSLGFLYSCDSEKRDEDKVTVSEVVEAATAEEGESVKLDERGFVDRTNWVITTDESKSSGVNNLLTDNNEIWHTEWKDNNTAELPHEFVVDMIVPTEVKGFYFHNRELINGAMREIELFKSNDNTNWTSLGAYELDAKPEQYVVLDEGDTFQYVKVRVNRTIANVRYSHLREFAVFPVDRQEGLDEADIAKKIDFFVDRSRWTIDAASNNGAVMAGTKLVNIIKGGQETGEWTTDVKGKISYHTFIVDMKESVDVKGFVFINYKDEVNNIGDVKIYKRNEKTESWAEVGVFSLQREPNLFHRIKLDNPDNMRYIKVEVQDTWGSQYSNITLGEFGAYK